MSLMSGCPQEIPDSPLRQLASLLSPEQVVTEEAALAEASADRTEAEPQQPQAVVKPRTVEEVQAVVRWANQHRIPLTPVVANTNLGGLALPAPGGVVVDLKEMNRIVEVDETAMYAVLEPGVTFGDLRRYLDRHHPDLIAAYPLSPPEASVLCNCLLDGLTNLSFHHGTAGDLINGLEVVLPTGELLYTGSAALRWKMENGEWRMESRNPVHSPLSTLHSPLWTSRAPLPDLTGLFLNWQGTTGIVTKLALQLWPKLAYRQRLFVLAYDRTAALGLLRRLARQPLFDDLGGVSWVLGKMMFGVLNPAERDPGEPEFYLYVDQSAETAAELRLKRKRLDGLLAQARREGVDLESPLDIADLIRANPPFRRFGDFPMSLDFLLDHPGGGLTWVGTYGPLAQWEEGAQRGEEILGRYGFPPAIVVRAMRRGHFGVLRFILVFDRADPEAVARVRAANAALCDAALELGFIPYKTPAWAVQRMLDRLDPGFLALLKNLKALLDPNGIMNPGKWLL